MAEKLDIYDLDGRYLRTQDRKEYYTGIKQQREETGEIDTQVKTIRIRAMRPDGKHILQRRSFEKSENAWLYDKFVGGHIENGTLAKLTLAKECMEEFRVPAMQLTKEELVSTLLNDGASQMLMEKMALVREVDYLNKFVSVRTYTNKQWQEVKMKQPMITTLYVGYYNGDTNVGKDGETWGIQIMSDQELRTLLQRKPEDFTNDVHYITKHYAKELISIKDFLK